jgi:hypothetical protein
MAEAQGTVTDLLVLRNRLRPWAVARADPGTADLLEELRARIERRRRAVEREGERAFARRPRAFARRVIERG